jgi:cytochrome c
MSGHEESDFNKIAKGVLFAGILAMVAGFIADGLYHPKTPEKTAFAIEIPEEGVAGEAAVVEAEVDINELMATADAASGESIASKKCAACHSFEAGGANKTGPNLHGTFGGSSAHHAGYPYSSALKDANLKWDYETLNEWLKSPQSVAKGSKMVLKIKKDSERADLIKYLESIK